MGKEETKVSLFSDTGGKSTKSSNKLVKWMQNFSNIAKYSQYIKIIIVLILAIDNYKIKFSKNIQHLLTASKNMK